MAPQRYVVVVYDVKQASESKTAPHLRVAPLKDARLRKLICATMDARRQSAGADALQLMPGDMYFLFDGKRPKNAYKFKGVFVGDGDGDAALPKKDRELQLIFAEKGLAERKYINRRGAASIKQSERVHMITRHRPKLPTRKRRHFPGSNLGDTITEIPVLSHEEMWRLPLEKKRRLYDKYRVDVGGKESSSDSDEAAVVDEDEENPAAKARHAETHVKLSLPDYPLPLALLHLILTTSFNCRALPLCPACQKRRGLGTGKTDDEPVFFFELPKALVEELLHTSQAKGVIDLTAGAGTWAIACLEMGLPYLGVVLTEMHLTELLAHLTKQALTARATFS